VRPLSGLFPRSRSHRARERGRGHPYVRGAHCLGLRSGPRSRTVPSPPKQSR
jgi:hypothetical protein